MEVERLTAVLEASGLAGFTSAMGTADRATTQTSGHLDALTSISKVATDALKNVKMTSTQALESASVASSIIAGVRGISDEARDAAAHLDEVKLSEAQAAESKASAEGISESLDQVGRNADQAKRKLAEVRLAGRGGGGGGGGGIVGGAGGGGISGFFGASPAMVGLVGAGITAAGPLGAAAGAAGLGLLTAAIGEAVPAAATLELAFHGMGGAIEGNLADFEKLTPEAQGFVQTVRSLIPWLGQLQKTAQQGVLPGANDLLHGLLGGANAAAIQSAVGGIGQALGAGMKEWGQAFQSPEFTSGFTDLMQHAEGWLKTDADAALQFAAGIGKIIVAGSPLVDWLTNAADAGARTFDEWVTATQASGGLASGMQSMEHELDLVWHLFEALATAGFDVAQVLTPLGNEVVVELTDGLEDLAKWVEQNKTEINDVAQGALQAFTSGLKLADQILVPLGKDIYDVTQATIGFKNAFEILLGLAVASKLAGWGGELLGVGTAAKTAEGEVVGLRGALLGLEGLSIAIPIAVIATPALIKLMKWAGSGISAGFGPTAGGAANMPHTPATGAQAADTDGGLYDWWAVSAAQLGGKTPAYWEQHGGAASALLTKHGINHAPGINPATGTPGPSTGPAASTPASLSSAFQYLTPSAQQALLKTQTTIDALTGQTGALGITAPSVTPSSFSAGLGNPFSTPPPFNATSKTTVLPQALQTAIDNATFGAAQGGSKAPEIQALQVAITWIKSHIGAAKGQTSSMYAQEGTALIGQLQSLTGMKVTSVTDQVLPRARQAALSHAEALFSSGTASGSSPAQNLRAVNELLTTAGDELSFLTSEQGKYTAGSTQALEVAKEMKAVQEDIARAQGEQTRALKEQQKLEAAARTTSVQGQMARLLGIGPGTGVAGVGSIKSRERTVLLDELKREMKPLGHVKGAISAATLPSGATSASITELVSMIEKAGVRLPTATKESLKKINDVLALSLKEHVKLGAVVSQNVTERLSEINDTLKTLVPGMQGNLHVVSAEKLTAGLGLTATQRHAEEARYAQALSHGGKAPTGATVAGIPVTSGMAAAGLHVHGDIVINVDGRDAVDPKVLAAKIREELEKTARRNSVQQRGRFAGRSLGLG